MLNEINNLYMEKELLIKELEIAPERKEYIDNKIKEIENKLAALEKAWFFEEVDD